MPPRTELKPQGNRPTSAIYLGNSPSIAGPSSSKYTPSSSSPYDNSVQTPPSLPDLPEPPSPESSPGSRRSGLPSPPATNSTGSGSTGDPGSIALRQRPLSLASDSSGSSHRTLSERSITRSRSNSRSSYLRDEPLPTHEGDDYEEDINDLDGDQTARLDRGHHSSEHSLALQRVRSLTQRNRMAIDKLAKLGSPSPSSSASSSRVRQSRATLPLDQGASGSETERESTSASSSSRRPITPPSRNHHVALTGATSPYSRFGKSPNPDSPQKTRLTPGSSPSNNSPTARRRKRASMATIPSCADEDEDDDSRFSTATGRRDRVRDDAARDIAKSALAAVASSRTSLSLRRRGALPQEFVENTDPAETKSIGSRRSDDMREHNRYSMDPVTPYKGLARSSTLRETGRTSQGLPRWTSDASAQVAKGSEKKERRPTLRGGSAESALVSPGRTVVSEGLRAAGLARREEIQPLIPANTGDVFRDRERRAATPSRDFVTRAATSMADYRSLDRYDDEPEPRSTTSARRNHRSTYSMTRESDLTRHVKDLSLTPAERSQLGLDRKHTIPTASTGRSNAAPKQLRDRHSTATPYSAKRHSQATVTSTDHVQLMLETLQSFEGSVSKLPPGLAPAGKISSATELLKHAQNVVHITERINTLMRQGTSKALEEQINAEVDASESVSAEEMLEVWRKVGGEYREGLRASDELVRALTSFLIDVGSTLRKLSPSCTGSEYSSPGSHTRSMSLEEEVVRQQAPSSGSSGFGGRKSVDVESISRRSLDREETLWKLSGRAGRESSLGLARASPALAAFRDRERNVYDTPSPASTSVKPMPMSASEISTNPVRLFPPSQQRDRELGSHLEATRNGSTMGPSDSQKTVQPPADVEPSPTPASRIKERTGTILAVAPLSRPPTEGSRLAPISRAVSSDMDSLASASVQKSSSVRERAHERRKPSVTSIITIRGSQAPSFPNLTTPSTALTSVTPTTVSNSPDQMHVPAVLRTESMGSAKTNIAFSRPSTSALSDIQQVKEGHRKQASSIGNGLPSYAEDSPALSREFASRTFSRARAFPKADSRPGSSPRSSPRVASADYGSNVDANLATPFGRGSTVHAADRHAASTMLPQRAPSIARERRTVTDIFP